MYLVMAITDRKDDRDTDPNMCVCVQGDKKMIIRNATLQLYTHWAYGLPTIISFVNNICNTCYKTFFKKSYIEIVAILPQFCNFVLLLEMI